MPTWPGRDALRKALEMRFDIPSDLLIDPRPGKLAAESLLIPITCRETVATEQPGPTGEQIIRNIEAVRLSFDSPMPRIFESPYLTRLVQTRFPRSKKRRIRKKWAKRQENFRSEPDPCAYILSGVLYAHPATARAMKADLVKSIEAKIEREMLGQSPLGAPSSVFCGWRQ